MENHDIPRRIVQLQNTPGEAHYLTFSCFQKRRFLIRDRTRQYVVGALDRARAKHKFDLWAYVIMPTHIHVLLFPREDVYDMGKIETTIKLSVTRRAMNYLRRYNPEGLRYLATGQRDTPYRFWQQGEGYDENLSTLEAAHAIAEYIHNNPVRAGLVANQEDWKWSSAREWLIEGSGPLSLDKNSFL
tara:strand:- start:682 stop:1242 length:561 start_codon:yes stop_codon:yes gene_type:complete